VRLSEWGKAMRAICDFLTDEKGAVTVDFVVWIPLFVSLLVIVTDASMIYLTQTEMWNVARDIARRMTSRSINTLAEARCQAEQQLNLYSFLTYDVDVFSSQDINSVTIRVPLDDVSAFGYFIKHSVLGESISATVTMRADPTIKEAMEQGTCDNGGGGNGGGGTGGGGKGGGKGNP